MPSDRDTEPVRVFETCPLDRHALGDGPVAGPIDTVAMESTGIYAVPSVALREPHGVRPCLVKARQGKTVPGRKPDWHEAQWLQQLHTRD